MRDLLWHMELQLEVHRFFTERATEAFFFGSGRSACNASQEIAEKGWGFVVALIRRYPGDWLLTLLCPACSDFAEAFGTRAPTTS